jgi:hypothetical protein
MTRLCALLTLVFTTGALFAEEPAFKFGLTVGQRPGPYAFVLATGPQRGQAFCYICDTGDKPAAIIFARSLTDPLGKLAARLDQAAADGTVPLMRTWLTLLDDGKQPDLERRLVAWGLQHAIKTMPLGIFDDEVGPPSYRLNRDAQATVLLFVKQKVVANFAFRAGEITEAKIAEVAKALDFLKVKGEK